MPQKRLRAESVKRVQANCQGTWAQIGLPGSNLKQSGRALPYDQYTVCESDVVVAGKVIANQAAFK